MNKGYYAVRSMIWEIFLKINSAMSLGKRIKENSRRFRASVAGHKLMEHLGYASTSRVIENQWILNNLTKEKTKILDVGCCNSFFVFYLLDNGYDTWGIDIRDCPINNFYKQDISKKTTIPGNSFDIITCVSTIEHIGLGSYGDRKDGKGDLNAMQEIRRILKPKGLLLLTIPYSSVFKIEKGPSDARLYDSKRLDMLIKGFKIIQEEHFLMLHGRYEKMSKNIADNIYPKHRDDSIVCLKLVRKK
jgi:SAM-dependent methyltransferase